MNFSHELGKWGEKPINFFHLFSFYCDCFLLFSYHSKTWYGSFYVFCNLHDRTKVVNPLIPGSDRDLTDFTLSNARRFYSSTGGLLGHLRCQWVTLRERIYESYSAAHADHQKIITLVVP